MSNFQYESGPSNLTVGSVIKDGTPMQPIEVIVIADYACPWCYIGKQALAFAAKQTRIPIKMIFQPYIINPNTPPGSCI